MRINDDFSKPVIVHAARQDWIPSPVPGVDRRMLFRIGEEKARATSIVRYGPGSAFPRHIHTGGEEFIVLDGIFQDEHGDYPAGSYIRNPPETSHVPASAAGVTIFVRLWQFRADDRDQTIRFPGEGLQETPRQGADAALVLFDDGHEQVRLESWKAGACVTIDNPNGLEFLVLSGNLIISGDLLEPQSWGRLPAGLSFNTEVGSTGTRLWMKNGPLLHKNVRQL